MEKAGPPEQATPKPELRRALRAARRARTPRQRDLDAAALARAALAAPPLAALGPGAVVAAYASTPAEPGTGPLRAALAARGLVVLLPVVRPGATPVGPGVPVPLGWVGEDGAAHPTGLAAADVVLLPALAVDASGTRLGQGGGHYDRTLTSLQALDPGPAPASCPGRHRPLLIAVVHPDEVLAPGALPREAHDVPVDAVLTPLGLRLLGDQFAPAP